MLLVTLLLYLMIQVSWKSFPFLYSIVTESAKIPAKVIGFILTLPKRIKSALSGGQTDSVFEAMYGDQAPGTGMQIFQNIIDIAAGVPTAVLSYMQLVISNVRDTLSEVVPNLPFFDSILNLIGNVFARGIILISTMKTVIKGLLNGTFDSSLFFQGIADFALGIAGDVFATLESLVAEAKVIVAEHLPNVPFLQSILTFAGNVFARGIILISTMKTVIKGLLNGTFDSSAFFEGISTFASGVVEGSVQFIRDLVADVKEILGEKISEIPFLGSILTFAGVKVFGPVVKLFATMKAVVAGLLSGEPGSPAFFKGIADYAADFATNAATSAQTMISDVKGFVAEHLPNVPFLQSILSFAGNVFGRVVSLISVLKTVVTGLLNGTFDSNVFFQGIADFALGVAGSAAETIQGLIGEVKTIVAETLPDVPFLQSILTFAGNVFGRVVTLISNMKSVVTGLLSGDEGAGDSFFQSVGDFAGSIVLDATTFLNDVIAGLGDVDFGSAGTEAGKLAGAVINKIIEWVGSLSLSDDDSSITDLSTSIGEFLGSLIRSAGDWIGGAIGGLGENLEGVNVRDVVSGIVSGLINAAVGLISGFIEGLRGGDKSAGKVSMAGMHPTKSPAGDQQEQVRLTASEVVESMLQFVIDTLIGIVEGVINSDFGESIGTWVSELWESVKSRVQELVDTIKEAVKAVIRFFTPEILHGILGVAEESGPLPVFGSITGATGGGSGGFQGGGYAHAGNLYRVNERNMEYFQPSVGGQVIPLAPAGAAGGGDMVFNIQNLNASGYDEGREAARGLADEIEFLMRSRG